MKIAVAPASTSATVPETGVAPGPLTMNVAVVIVAGFIAFVKVAVILLLIGTPESALAGAVEVTEGGIITTPVPWLETPDPPPWHPAKKAAARKSRNHITRFEWIPNPFICVISPISEAVPGHGRRTDLRYPRESEANRGGARTWTKDACSPPLANGFAEQGDPGRLAEDFRS